MREVVPGLRVAVAGLGVSGQASALALHRLGAKVTALDEKPALSGPTMEAADRLQNEGIEVVTGWPGRLDPRDYDVLVVSPGFPNRHPALLDMEGKVWGEIELAWRIAKAPILAVTGTNGKSTTVVLTWMLLKAEGVKARLCGNIAGSGYPEMALTQAAFEAGSDEILVAEVSSFQLETVSQFRPRAAAITNITPDHLDRHGSFEAYRDAKLKLFRQMGEGGRIVRSVASPLPTREMALQPGTELVEVDPSRGGPGVSVREDGLLMGGFFASWQDLPQRGPLFLANLMVAWELASSVALLGEKAAKAVLSFRGLDHRLEVVGEAGGVKIINNSMCTNPAAAAGSIAAVGRPQWVLIGGKTKGMGEGDYAPLKEELAKGHRALLFGQDSALLQAWLGGGHRVCSSMLEALAVALEEAAPGEAVHLAPGAASSEPYSSFRERGEAFRQAAKEWLEK